MNHPRRAGILLATLALSLSASGCELVGDVLEFGFWTIIVLVLILAAVVWGGLRMIQRMGRRRDHDAGGPPPPGTGL